MHAYVQRATRGERRTGTKFEESLPPYLEYRYMTMYYAARWIRGLGMNVASRMAAD